MKTPRSRGPFACLATVGVSLLLTFGNIPLRAGGVGAVAGTSVASGAAVGGGGHSAGPVSTGGAHVVGSAPVHTNGFSSAGVSNAFRNGSNLRPMTASYGGAPHYLPGGFAPTVVSHAPSMRVGGPRYTPATTAARADGFTANNAAAVRQATVHNAWSDPVTGGVVNGQRSNFSGTVLYPNTLPDDPASRFGNGNVYAAGSGFRSSRYNAYNRRYFPFYGYPYPYLFSGGYAPYFDGGDLGVGTAAAIGDADNAATGSNALSAAAVNDLSRPYPSETYAANPVLNAPANAPAADAAQGSASRSVQENTGPDSLVEAVQAELSRRGYFGGKVDAVYNAATHTAIQRFQADQQLPATGRINEATLHALQLD